MNSIFSFLISLILTSQLISACFITNCPPGGKRSLSSVSIKTESTKQCQKCGPTNEGQCFGPNICCGPGIGCQINNEITKVCRIENLSTKPCYVEGKKCGNSLNGICATGKICCESDRCYEDKNCVRKIDFEFGSLKSNNYYPKEFEILEGEKDWLKQIMLKMLESNLDKESNRAFTKLDH